MNSHAQFRSGSSRLLKAIAALPPASLAAAVALAVTPAFADTTVAPGYNAYSTESTLALGNLTRSAGGSALFSGNGTISAAATLSNGLVGPWAIVQKSGAAANNASTGYTFATITGGNVVPYTAATAVVAGGGAWGNVPSGTNSTVNYDSNGTFAATGVARDVNSIRFTAAGGNQTSNNSNFVALKTNALLNAGTGDVAIGSASGNVLAVAIGATNELVLAAGSASITFNATGRIYNNGTTVASSVFTNGATAGAVVITGPNNVNFGGSALHTGATYVNGGTLTVNGAGTWNNTSGIIVNGPAAKYVHTSSVASTPTISLTQGTVDGTSTLGTVNVGNSTGAIVTNGNGGTGTLTIGTLAFAGAGTITARPTSSTKGINVTGTLSTTPASGTVTINAASSSGWSAGTYNLIGFGSFTGSLSDFALGTVSGLNARQSAGALLLNGSNLAIQISGDSPKWTGAQSGAWTTDTVGGAKNWKLVTGGTTTEYLAGDEVLFDDTATGTTSIDISTANVAPATVTFNNSTKNYTISSSGGFGISNGTLTKSGSGTVTLTTTNTYTGATTINAGTLQLGDGSTDGSIATSGGITDNGALVYNLNGSQTYAGAITGTGSLTKSGPGTLTLTGASTYSGGTIVSSGKLVALSTGLNGGPIQIASGATLTFTGNSLVSTSAVSGAGAILNDTANTIVLSGDFSGFTGSLTHSSATNNTQFSTSVSGSENASYTLTAGEFICAANGDYTVKMGSLSSTAGNIRGGNTATGTTTLEVGHLGTSTSIAGNLNNGATKIIALNKVGAGSLTINGTNNLGGGTTVSAGALFVNGTLSSTANAVTVASGATLGGTGTIAGATTVNGQLAPGSGSVGVLTLTGALTLNTGSSADFEINGLNRGTDFDGVNVTGTFTLGGTVGLHFGGTLQAGTYTLFQFSGSTANGFAAVTAASTATPSPVSLVGSSGIWTGTLDGMDLSFNSTTGMLTVSAPAHTALQTWRFDQFGVYDDTADVLAGDAEDFDGDGLSNLLEYALGTDPKASTAGALTVGRSGNFLTLTYPRRSPADASITYTVEASGNLSTGFTAATGATNTVGSTSTYTDDVDATTAGRRFLRLTVTHTP